MQSDLPISRAGGESPGSGTQEKGHLEKLGKNNMVEILHKEYKMPVSTQEN
jgi:hypothetical protein